MTQKQKLWVTVGLQFMAFGYTADGYQMAAYLFATFAVWMALQAHSYKCLLINIEKTAVYAMAAVLLSLPLVEEMPALWYVAACTCISAVLFGCSSCRVLHKTVYGLRITMIVFYLLAVLFQGSIYGIYACVIMITLAFMPLQIVYCFKIMHKETDHRKKRLETRPSMY